MPDNQCVFSEISEKKEPDFVKISLDFVKITSEIVGIMSEIIFRRSDVMLNLLNKS